MFRGVLTLYQQRNKFSTLNFVCVWLGEHNVHRRTAHRLGDRTVVLLAQERCVNIDYISLCGSWLMTLEITWRKYMIFFSKFHAIWDASSVSSAWTRCNWKSCSAERSKRTRWQHHSNFITTITTTYERFNHTRDSHLESLWMVCFLCWIVSVESLVPSQAQQSSAPLCVILITRQC